MQRELWKFERNMRPSFRGMNV